MWIFRLVLYTPSIPFNQVTRSESSQQQQEITGIERDLENDFLIIGLKGELNPKESYNVTIDFVSRVADDRLNGLYLDYYFYDSQQDEDDGSSEEIVSTARKHYIATTLFAPNHARKAFPCFDEPALKAPFQITIGRAGNYSALSNGKLLRSEPM